MRGFTPLPCFSPTQLVLFWRVVARGKVRVFYVSIFQSSSLRDGFVRRQGCGGVCGGLRFNWVWGNTTGGVLCYWVPFHVVWFAICGCCCFTPYGTKLIKKCILTMLGSMGELIIGIKASALICSGKGAGVEEVRGLVSMLSSVRGSNVGMALISSNTVNINAKGLKLRRHPGSAPNERTTSAMNRYRLVCVCSGVFDRCNRGVNRLLFAGDSIRSPREHGGLVGAFSGLFSCNTVPMMGRGSTVNIRRVICNSGSYLSTVITGLVKTSTLVVLASVSKLCGNGPAISRSTRVVPAMARVASRLVNFTNNRNSGFNANKVMAGLRTTRVTVDTKVSVVIVGNSTPRSVCGTLSNGRVKAFFMNGGS